MILDFAFNSQMDDGQRIIERYLRHGLDPRMKSMFRNEADIILLEGDSVELVTTAKVPVLMKSVWYHTTTENLAKDILDVACGCKCGSTTDEEIAVE